MALCTGLCRHKALYLHMARSTALCTAYCTTFCTAQTHDASTARARRTYGTARREARRLHGAYTAHARSAHGASTARARSRARFAQSCARPLKFREQDWVEEYPAHGPGLG
jgi:hypothetical protein